MNALIQHTKMFYTSLMEGDFVWYLRSIRIAVPSPQMADEVLLQDVCYGTSMWVLQHIGRILNAYFPEDKPAEIFLTAVQYGMPHRESVRRLLYDSDFNHGSLRFRSWDNSIFSQGTFAGYDIRESAFCFAISGNRQIRCRSPPAALMEIKNL